MNLTTSGEIMYCITHEKEVDVFAGTHIYDNYAGLGEVRMGWCVGPFTFCPPPAVPEDWELVAECPDDEFMAQSDACAEQLLKELA